jgi:hypothetical protein
LSTAEGDAFHTRVARAGVTPSEHLRNLILDDIQKDSFEARITSMENRLLHVETELARMWSQEGRHGAENL